MSCVISVFVSCVCHIKSGMNSTELLLQAVSDDTKVITDIDSKHV